jgi:hypothetical protein
VFRSLPYLLCGIDKFVRGFSLFGHLNHIGVHISDSFGITEGHTLGITVTKVAFHSDPLLDIKEWVPKGACDDTGPAPDTQILVDHHSVIIISLPVAGLGRTDFDAIGFFTVIADHGKVNPHMLPFDHLDPGSARIA